MRIHSQSGFLPSEEIQEAGEHEDVKIRSRLVLRGRIVFARYLNFLFRLEILTVVSLVELMQARDGPQLRQLFRARHLPGGFGNQVCRFHLQHDVSTRQRLPGVPFCAIDVAKSFKGSKR